MFHPESGIFSGEMFLHNSHLNLNFAQFYDFANQIINYTVLLVSTEVISISVTTAVKRRPNPNYFPLRRKSRIEILESSVSIETKSPVSVVRTAVSNSVAKYFAHVSVSYLRRSAGAFHFRRHRKYWMRKLDSQANYSSRYIYLLYVRVLILSVSTCLF